MVWPAARMETLKRYLRVEGRKRLSGGGFWRRVVLFTEGHKDEARMGGLASGLRARLSLYLFCLCVSQPVSVSLCLSLILSLARSLACATCTEVA